MDGNAVGMLIGLLFDTENKLKNEIKSYIGTNIVSITSKTINNETNIEFVLVGENGNKIVNIPITGILTEEQRNEVMSIVDKLEIIDGEIQIDGNTILTTNLITEIIQQDNHSPVSSSAVFSALENLDLGVEKFIDLEDVSLNNLVNNDILCYDTINNKIINVPLSSICEKSQVVQMEEPNGSNLNKVVQYIGESVIGSYQCGYFYICTYEDSKYIWKNIDVQKSQENNQVWVGTNSELSSLTQEQKSNYIIFITTDDNIQEVTSLKKNTFSILGDGVKTEFLIEHNGNNLKPIINLYDENNNIILCDINIINSNSIKIQMDKPLELNKVISISIVI